MYFLLGPLSHRWDVLSKYVPTLTVKPICETRWEVRVDALRVLRDDLGPVYDALVSLSEDENMKDVTGTKTRADAQAPLVKYLILNFLCCNMVQSIL